MRTELKEFWLLPFNMSNIGTFFRHAPNQYGWLVDGLIFISGEGDSVNSSEVDRHFIVSTIILGTDQPDEPLTEVTLRVDESVEPPIPVSIINIGGEMGFSLESETAVTEALQELIPEMIEEENLPFRTVAAPPISVNWGVLLDDVDGKSWVCVDVEEAYARQIFNRLVRAQKKCWLVRALGGKSVGSQYDVVQQNNC